MPLQPREQMNLAVINADGTKGVKTRVNVPVISKTQGEIQGVREGNDWLKL